MPDLIQTYHAILAQGIDPIPAAILAVGMASEASAHTDDRLWTLKECAAYLGISEASVAYQAEHCGLHHRRIGKGGKGDFRFVPDLVREWAAQSDGPQLRIVEAAAPRPRKRVRR